MLHQPHSQLGCARWACANDTAVSSDEWGNMWLICSRAVCCCCCCRWCFQVAESKFLNNKLVEVVGFMENIARERQK